MAAGALDIVVRFIGDASSIETQAAKVEGTGAKLKTWAKGVGAAIGVAFAANQVKDWVASAEEAEAASARLAQTLRNAGDATGAWTKQAEALATTLMNKTGIDDEVIKGGESILATFHSVSNAAAQQNGIFAGATQAALDLSKTGFGDVDSAAKQLGKALEDPVKGITALKRAGVNFTQAQKDQIAALVQSGDLLGAQKIILGEVQNQVGGVAEKTATAGQKMSTAWHETQESLGKALLPVLQQLAPILQKIATFVQQNATWLVPLAAAVLAVVAAVKAWTIIQGVLNVLMSANPVGAIILGLVALIAIIVLVVKHWDDIKAAAVDAFHWVLDAIQSVWNWIQANWPLLLSILLGPVTAAVYQIVTHWQMISDALGAALDFMTGLWNAFVAFLASIPGRVWGVLSSVGGFIVNAFASGLNAIGGLIEGVVGWFAGLPGRVVGALASLGSSMFTAAVNAMNDFLRGLESMMSKIADKVANFAKDMLSKLNPFGSPQTVAYYRGRDVMRDYVAGAQSAQRSSVAAFRALGAAAASSPAPSAGGGGMTIHVNVVTGGLGADAPEVQRAVVEAIRGYVGRNGRLTGVT